MSELLVAKRRGREPIDVAAAACKLMLEVDRACLDPPYPAKTRTLCERAGVPRSTLDDYKANPAITPVLRRIADLERARNSHAAAVAGAPREPDGDRSRRARPAPARPRSAGPGARSGRRGRRPRAARGPVRGADRAGRLGDAAIRRKAPPR